MNTIAMLCTPLTTPEGMRAGETAREAIALYREYVDVHGYDADRAAAAAYIDMVEGASTDPLIAAAPEMLALLKNLHADLARYSKMFEGVASSCAIAFASMADDCARLVAKAEGRTDGN